MLTTEGCRERRRRLWKRLDPQRPGFPAHDYLVVGDPVHLMYLANAWTEPFSLSAGFGACLVLRRNGDGLLICDDLLAPAMDRAHVDARVVVAWYDGEHAGRGPRRLALESALARHSPERRIHDRLGDPVAPALASTLGLMRRQKDGDEVALLRRCMKASDAGHAWALNRVKPGMTELEVYCGVSQACIHAAAQPAVVYGDFIVSPGPERRTGLPTGRLLAPGDMCILDFSVVIGGYRSDTSNTLAVGGEPNAEQRRLYELCRSAMAAGEERLAAGALCRDVYQAVHQVFEQAGVADHFPHHAGHGIGLTHPESPFFVRQADEELLSGDVVTLEPGLYVSGIGGIRIEHNYLVTAQGYERLSNHPIALTS
jgi:Xaa-Pro aminopeptidase